MRPRFSLRLLLIAFTLVAILFGGWSHLVWRVKEQIRRQEWALANDFHNELWRIGMYELADAPPPTSFAAFAKRWIDPTACSPVQSIDARKSLDESQAIQFLKTSQDLYGLKHISLDVTSLTPEMVTILKQCSSLRTLDLSTKSIDPNASRQLTTMKALRRFALVEAPMDDLTANSLCDNAGLEEISMDPTALSNETLARFACLKQLSNLEFRGNIQTRGVIAPLIQCRTIEELRFENCQLSDEAIADWKAAKSIATIRFRACRMPDSLSAELSRISGLRTCRILETTCSDKAMAQLENCKSLVDLDLSYSDFTNNRLARLDPPSTLKTLTLTSSLPDESLLEFLKRLPKCTIVLWGRFERPGKEALAGRVMSLENGELRMSELYYDCGGTID